MNFRCFGIQINIERLLNELTASDFLSHFYKEICNFFFEKNFCFKSFQEKFNYFNPYKFRLSSSLLL